MSNLDLYIDKDALKSASDQLANQSDKMRELRTTIIQNFDLLKADWDSDAGRLFFARFETDLLKNLEDYAKVFDYISQNLTMASTEYEAVFSAADAVTNVEL